MIDLDQIGPGGVVNILDETGVSVTSEVDADGQFTGTHEDGTTDVFIVEEVSFISLPKR